MRNGKPVTIELDDNYKIISARVDLERGRSRGSHAADTEPAPAPSPTNGKPVGKDLNFAIAVVSAIRRKYSYDPMVTRGFTCQELADLYCDILKIIGKRGCTKQNINRIECRAKRKLSRNKELEAFMKEILKTK